MPKVMVVRLYCDERLQDLPTVARRFHVSQAAMRVRLLQLGLTRPGRRHGAGRHRDGLFERAAA